MRREYGSTGFVRGVCLVLAASSGPVGACRDDGGDAEVRKADPAKEPPPKPKRAEPKPAPPPAPPAEITIRGRKAFGGEIVPLKEAEREVVERAVEVFRETCKPLVTSYWADVESATAELASAEYSYRADRYGWKAEVYIAVKLRERTRHVPERLRPSGHVLNYYLGGGKQPGIVAQKTVSQEVCGMSAPSGSDAFRAIPDLAFIK